MKWLLIVLIFVVVTLPTNGIAQQQASSGPQAPRTVSAADKSAVIQAIVDEMYANSLQQYVDAVGERVGPRRTEFKLKVYFQPTYSNQGTAWAIYKLLPYGEVFRMFTMTSDGLAVLYGKLRNGFPQTEPSYLTVFMDDDQLCRTKSEWPKEYFAVSTDPGAQRIAEARTRQQKRGVTP